MREKPDLSPSELVLALRDERQSIFDGGAHALVKQFGAPLHGYIRRLGLEEADASEVLNDVLYTAVRKIDQLERPEKLTGWLYRLAYSASMDWHRKYRLVQERQLTPEQWSILQDPRSEGEPTASDPNEVGLGQLQAAVNSLSDRDRDILNGIAHGLDNEELAEHFNVTPANARVLRHRVLERLRREYQRIRAADSDELRSRVKSI